MLSPVLVKGVDLSYHNKETLLFTLLFIIDPYHGDLY